MERPGGASSVMRYDGVGQRIWKGAGNGTGEHSVLDGAETVAVTDGAGAVQHWNLLAGGVVGRYEPTGAARRYYVRDHLGSVRQQVDASGTVLSYGEDYYPFGLQMPGRSMVSDAPNERFTGKELDDETGLYYFGKRYYDPVIGRWPAVDPILDRLSPNKLLETDVRLLSMSPYNYAYNNPVNLTDPDGQCPCLAPALPWLIGAAKAAFYTAATVVGAYTGAAVLHEVVNGTQMQPGAPPVAGVDIDAPLISAPDATGVSIPNITGLNPPAVDDFSLLDANLPMSVKALAGAIASGHAFDKHVVERGEYPGIATTQEFAKLVQDAVNNAIDSGNVRELRNDRVAYWDNGTGTVVIYNPKDPDSGTAFRPENGKEYFDNLR